MHLPRLVVLLACALIACHSDGPASPASPASPKVAEHPAAGHHPGHSWDDIYRQGTGFNLAPNKLLIESIQGVTPGAALDIGMGQGRNAVFLARQGWNVTGVDTSAEGVRIATESARAAGVDLHGIVQDISTFDLGTARWNLIAMIYMDDRALIERIKTALAPGGLFVLEFFHSDSNNYLPHPVNGFHTGELDALFSGFTILRTEVVEDVADFGERPAKLVRFIARKPAA